MLYVQYGCGFSAPKEWKNFDASPSVKIQEIPLVGKLLKRWLRVVFPSNVHYGNIVRGLPVKDGSCDGLYCSHVLEHLSLQDFRIALKNSYKMLKRGVFRCVVPDLEFIARTYINALDAGECSAGTAFFKSSYLGLESRPKGLRNMWHFLWGCSSRHLWMWDKASLSMELKNAGFVNIRQCELNDSNDKMFGYVEDEGRFRNSIAFECSKQ